MSSSSKPSKPLLKKNDSTRKPTKMQLEDEFLKSTGRSNRYFTRSKNSSITDSNKQGIENIEQKSRCDNNAIKSCIRDKNSNNQPKMVQFKKPSPKTLLKQGKKLNSQTTRKPISAISDDVILLLRETKRELFESPSTLKSGYTPAELRYLALTSKSTTSGSTSYNTRDGFKPPSPSKEKKWNFQTTRKPKTKTPPIESSTSKSEP